MSIDKSNMISAIQSNIDSASSSCDTCDLVALAAATNIVTTDRKTVVALGCDLPDLYTGTAVPEGTIYYVQELGVPVVATDTSWQGLDGRLYREDAPINKIYSAGCNFPSGPLGVGNTLNYSSPVQEITSSTDWSTLSSGNYHPIAIKINGTLWSWGLNGYGQLGDRTVICRSSPVQEITSSTDWCLSSGGTDHSLGIKTAGTLWGWGRNSCGQVGDRTGINRSSPVQEISSSTNWCFASAGQRFNHAIKTSGTLWSWGSNNFGLSGTNSTISASSPVQEISSSTDWCFVSAGGYNFSLGIKTSGTLWAWGKNADAFNNITGALGTGNGTCYSSPVQEISSSTDWTRVSAGGYHSLGLKSTGTLWGWGRNNCGQNGDGTSTKRSSPVQEVTSSTDWCFLSHSRANHSSAIKSNNTLWLWGRNSAGQLMDGTTINRSSPVQEVSSSTCWFSVSSGYLSISALTHE